MSVLALTLPISVEQPQWLWLLLLVPVTAVMSWRIMVALEPLRRVTAILFRCLVIAAVAFCLAGVEYVRESDKLTVFFLMDRSDSVKGLETIQEQYLRTVTEKIEHDQDRVGMIDFARSAYLEQMPMRGGYQIQPGALPEMENRDRTDLAGAIRLALAMFPHDSAKRIVLLSDGNDNMGDVLTEAATAQADGVVIDVVPLWYEHDNEVYFDRMVAPTNVEDGDMVPLRMLLHAERPTSGRLDIYVDGNLIEMPEDATRVKLVRGNNPYIVKVPVHGGGAHRFESRFVPDRPDRDDVIEENNYATTFSFVAGKSKALVLSINAEDDQPLVDALRSENIDVDLREVAGEELDLLGLLDYAVIVLANVPANTFTDRQQQSLAHYVSNMGGGLIMTGGDESFGAGGWIGSPVADVMPVHFEIKHKRVIPRGALVLILHSCEAPRGNYWGREMAKKSVDTISSRDYVGVLAYTFSPGGVNWEVPLQLASNKSYVKSRIDKTDIGDMPDFDAAMKLGLNSLQPCDAAQKHMIIISDGDPQPPSASVIRRMNKDKITCSTIAIGWGVHVAARTLQDIARKTGGRYYAPRNPKQLPQIFVKESKVVRRPLISEEDFTPQVQNSFSELLAGIDSGDSLPPLGGIVITSPKAEAMTSLIRSTTDGEDPVLAHWHAGLGKAVAFTSGHWKYWGDQWVNWPKFSKLWSQIVRWAMRQQAPDNLDVFTRVEGNKGRVVIDAVDKDAGYLNLLNLPAVVIKPDQSTERLVFTQTGAGHYEAQFDVDQTGQYITNVAVQEGGETMGSLQTGLSIPFSPEFRELATNEAMLRKVVDITGGRWLDDINNSQSHDVFSHDLPPNIAKQPVWHWALAWIFLPLFLLDVASRRLASWLAFSLVVELIIIVFLLFGVGVAYSSWWGILGVLLLGELVGWTIRYRSIVPAIDSLTHTVTALGRTGHRSTQSLGQLKDVRDRVRESHDDRDKAETTSVPTSGPSVDRGRRFDVGDEAAKGDVGDLREALGVKDVETAGPKEKRRPPAQTKGGEGEAEDATSRLLRAKRRAQRDMKKDKDEDNK